MQVGNEMKRKRLQLSYCLHLSLTVSICLHPSLTVCVLKVGCDDQARVFESSDLTAAVTSLTSNYFQLKAVIIWWLHVSTITNNQPTLPSLSADLPNSWLGGRISALELSEARSERPRPCHCSHPL